MASIGLIAADCGKPAKKNPDIRAALGAPEMRPSGNTGTVIVFLCDNPADIGDADRTYPARIGWSNGSEEFLLPLSRSGATVWLRNSVPRGESVLVRFFVMEDPPVATKYTRADWFYRGQPWKHDSSTGRDVLQIPYSAFRNQDNFAGSRAP